MSLKKVTRRTTIALIQQEEPPLSTESKKSKNFWGNAIVSKMINKANNIKNKNHLNKANQFLAFWLKVANKKTLAKISQREISRLHTAKNFIIEQRLIPHFVIVTLGLIVALCNVVVARGAVDLYKLIPADPSSQVEIASSIDRFTPVIVSDANAVEQSVTSAVDPNSGVFALDVRTTSTQISQREEAQAPSVGPRTKNISYTVQDGDTLTGLAMKFNVKSSSIQFANNLSNANLIKPGDTLKIPPDGWEPTASQIAARNKNNTSSRTSTSSKNVTVSAAPGRVNNGYPYGWCTYYVATRRAVPTSWGNAGQWLNSAKRAGYSTGSTPVAGAIVVTRESWWGHVAYVESVCGDSFTVAEMNYKGWGVTSRRTMSAGDGVIKGFVY